jgi:hypothetical protein
MLEVKNAIRMATIPAAEALAAAALELESTGEIVALLEQQRSARSAR